MESSRRSTRRKAREEQGTARPVSRTTTRRTRAKVIVAEPVAEEPENLRGSASNKAKAKAPATRSTRRGRAAKKAPKKEEEEEEEEEVLLEDSQATGSQENEASDAEVEEEEAEVAGDEEAEEEAVAEEDEEDDADEVMEEAEAEVDDEEMEDAVPEAAAKAKEPAAKENVAPLSIPAAVPAPGLLSDDRVATSAHGNRGAVPRLMIKCIQLTNFKSYAGTRTIGPFHHRFSAVVGPNGSGKSNLIDALLFVFGYRTKKLRLNKVSELIHNSNHGRGLPSAKVEVFFQQVIDIEGPGEKYDVLEDSEFSISRVATSDNKSMYYVNDQKKTFGDVQKELTKHHIDLNNNRFLILQGEVELISQMKPKAPSAHEDGLLEYIEDIIGTNALIPAIEEAAEKVHQTNVARSVQLNRVRAAEKAMGSLVEAKEEAEEHRSIQCQIIDHSACLYQLQAVSHQAQIDQLQADKEDITKTLEEVERRQEGYNTELESLDKEFSSKTKQHTSVHKDMLECKEQFDACEKKRTKLKTDIKHHQSKGKGYIKTEEKESKKERELQRSLGTAKDELLAAEEAIENLTEELKKEEEKLVEIQGSLKEKTSSLRQEMEVAKTELIPKKKKIGDLQAEIDVAQSELSMLEEEANASQQKLEETTAAIAAAKERAVEAGKLIKQKKDEVAKAKARLPDVEDEIRRTADQEQELAARKSDMEGTLDESAAQATASRSQSKVLQACMMLKAERNLSVYGRLGDLGSIDDKYDVAITTACGSQLDQVVVEKTADAQQCANYLKQHQVGRCTFLILEKIQGLRSRMMQGKGKTPAPRLFDLITPKSDIFLPAFYSVVRDTLLAQEFATAKKIAFGKQRYRVVTMTGQVIESSGLLSGGGNRQLRGGMRGSANSAPTMSKAEIAKLQKELQTVTKDLHAAREALNSLREEKSECEDLIEQSHLELTKLDMDVKGMQNQEKELAAQLPELKKRAAAKANAGDLKQIEALKSQIAKGQKPLKKAKADAEDIEATIKSLQDRIMDVGGMPLKIQQAKVDGIESQISDTHRVITRLQVKLKTMEKNVAKSTKAIAEAQAGAKEEEEHLASKKEELEGLVATAKDVKKKYEEAQASQILDDTSEELSGYTKKVEKAKSKLTKLRAAKTDLEIQLSDLAEKIKGSDGSRQGCYDKLKALEEEKMSLYDEYEQATADTKVRRLQADEVQSFNAKKIHGQVSLLKEKLETMSPNMGAIAEYRAQETEFHKREAELVTITEQRDELQRLCEELRKRRLDEFMHGFAIINTKLKEMYRLITLEGDAELEFVDTIDPFSEGIVFSVRPPKKSWKNIANLSGGEKTLSSLALVFALHHYKPTPLYFMDEIDAALDFKNVSIVAHYVKERTKNAQFIIISLRNNMFELADRLVGIYKPQNCTYSVAITPKEFSIGSQRSGAAVPV